MTAATTSLTLAKLSEQFWDSTIWCPPGVKWSDFSEDTAQFRDLLYAFITAWFLILGRSLLENTLFDFVGKYLCSIVNDSGKTIQPKPKLVKKFSEGTWRICFYTASSIYGWFFVLWDKPYKYDTMHTLKNFVTHPVTPEEWWYYNIELAFYLSLLLTQFTDTKRKDFWQMFAHHIVTISLIVLSWACHFHRIGCLVMAIHDVADIPLEGAKLAKYCKKQKIADIVFVIFTATWIFTRCYLLPKRILYYTAYKGLEIIEMYPAYYIFNSLICALQLLHFLWTYIIIKIVIDALKNDGMRDIRSESEDSHED